MSCTPFISATLAITVSAVAPFDNPDLYHPDPHHIWNRLHSSFYARRIETRSRENGTKTTGEDRFVTLGPDRIDLPLGRHPRFLLDDEPFAQCDDVLDEFLTTRAERLIDDPLKRVVLQHDLWAVFDLLQADPCRVMHGMQLEDGLPKPSADQVRRKDVLSRKIARVMQSLALSPERILKLPRPLPSPGASFTQLRPTPIERQTNHLLEHLHGPNNEWIELAFSEPHVPQHTRMVDGRSVFRIFYQQPGDPALVERLSVWWAQKARGATIAQPREPVTDLPEGIRFLLLRELICLNDSMVPIPTGIVESMRLYSTISSGQPDQAGRTFVELKMRRALIFRNRDAALEPTPSGARQFEGLSTLGRVHTDPKGRLLIASPFPQNCMMCHSGATLGGRYRNDASVRSLHTARPRRPNDRSAADMAIEWKKTQPDFHRLHEVWLRESPIPSNPE